MAAVILQPAPPIHASVSPVIWETELVEFVHRQIDPASLMPAIAGDREIIVEVETAIARNIKIYYGPAEIRRIQGLFERPDVRDAVAFLRKVSVLPTEDLERIARNAAARSAR